MDLRGTPSPPKQRSSACRAPSKAPACNSVASLHLVGELAKGLGGEPAKEPVWPWPVALACAGGWTLGVERVYQTDQSPPRRDGARTI